jgi:hypothetical protein
LPRTCTAESVAPNRPHDGFSVSRSTGSGIDGAILHVSRLRRVPEAQARRIAGRDARSCIVTVAADGQAVMMTRLPDHGRAFASVDEANAHALERGYVRRYFTAPDLRARRLARADELRADALAWKGLA